MMMKNLMLPLAGVVLTAAALAVPAAHAQSAKIGAIRTADVVLQSPQYKASAEKMKQEFDRRRNDLEAEAKKLEDDLKKFQREADLLSAADRAKTEKDLNTRRIDFGYKQRQFSEDMSNRDRQLTQEMRSKINDVILAVAKEKGYDLIVQDPAYAAEAVDITDEVLKRLKAGK
jgi:outer membrane protein